MNPTALEDLALALSRLASVSHDNIQLPNDGPNLDLENLPVGTDPIMVVDESEPLAFQIDELENRDAQHGIFQKKPDTMSGS